MPILSLRLVYGGQVEKMVLVKSNPLISFRKIITKIPIKLRKEKMLVST
jgi:hypothetical protein